MFILGISLAFGSGGGQQAGGGKTVLHVAHFYDPAGSAADQANNAWFNSVKTAFERQYQDITIEWEILQWDQIDLKMLSDYRSNITAHDVTLISPQLFPLHVEVGDLEDLSPFLKRDWDASRLAEFNWASTFQQGNINNKQIGIPLGSHARILAYNKAAFREAGLDPNKPPANLDELVSYAQKLTIDKDGDGTTDQYGLGLWLGSDRGNVESAYAPLVWGFGGDLINPVTKEAVFASDAGLKAAEYIWDLVNTYKVIPQSALVDPGNRTLDDGLLSGRVAMSLGWGAYYAPNWEAAGKIRGVTPPRADANLYDFGLGQYPTSGGAGFTNCWAISIYSRSRNKEAAWKFIDFLLGSDLSGYGDAGLPIKRTVWQQPEYQTEFFKTFYRAVEIGKPMPQTPYYGDLADIVAAALQRCMAAPKSDIARILRDAQQEFNSKQR
jgi:multiple sugar transport system substrate-binding protein